MGVQTSIATSQDCSLKSLVWAAIEIFAASNLPPLICDLEIFTTYNISCVCVYVCVCDQGQIYMYIPQYKVSRMKVRNKWTNTGGIGVNGPHLTDIHKGKFYKKGGGKGEEW